MTRSQAPPPPFDLHARQVVRGLSGAFLEVLTAAGADAQDVASIQRRMSLNKNLAWKISKIVQAENPLAVLQQMPGAAGLSLFLKAGQKAGAGEAILRSAREAIAEYETLIRVHSGDRATMEMMGSSLSPDAAAQTDEHYRKLLFQGASYVWGVQARVSLKVGLVGPGAEDGLLDFASVSALVDFRRLRSDVSWVLAMRESHNDDGTAMATSACEPIDQRYADPSQAPLMADFCSQPLPQLRSRRVQNHSLFELVEGPVGNMGAQTCVFGAIQRRIPYYRTETNEWGRHAARCDTPVEVLIVDLYFHRSFTFAIPPEPLLLSDLGGGPPSPVGPDRPLRLSERLADLGEGPIPLATPEVRPYNALVRATFDRMDWNPDEFHGFRMKIAYPACPTTLLLRYRLPARGTVSDRA